MIVRALGGYHFSGERLPDSAQLGQDERILEGAFGVVGRLRAFEPVEAGCGGGGMVAAGLRQAAVGEIAAEPREGVLVGGPAAACQGSLGQRA